MEKTFFGIVRRFGRITAVFALTATVGAIAWGVMLYKTSVNEAAVRPRLSYEEFRQSLRASPANRGQTGTGAQSASVMPEFVMKSAFDRQFDSYVEQIIANGNSYVSPEFTMKEEYLRATCKELADRFPVEQRERVILSFMEQFAKLSKAFADDPANRANIADPSERGRRWQNFTSWMFFTEIQTQMEAENQQVRKEAADANKVRAVQLLGAAGVAFVIFVFLTLMLVLIAIEKNTRPLAASASRNGAKLAAASVGA